MFTPDTETEMFQIHGDIAREYSRTRVSEARELRAGRQAARSLRAQREHRHAEQAVQQARSALARAL